jgi:glycosyltransferase involved in cell wall biosynthesis
MDKINYSVVIPVFNSEATLKELYHRITRVFENLDKSYEVIFVEDCGTDNSWHVIENLKENDPSHIIGIKFSKNVGQHNAILCGLNYVSGEFVITIDDDLQNLPEDIPKLIDERAASNSELVYGYYHEKKHNMLRNLGSNLIQLVFRNIFRTKGKITSFRLIDSELVKKIVSHKQNFVFIDGLLHWYTKYISYTFVEHEERKIGRSGYSFKKLVALSNNLIFNFTTYPLKIVIYLGIFFSCISFFIGFIFIFRKFVYDVPIGYTSIIVSIFFTAGLISLIIGAVGEYIIRIFTLQNDKPQFSVREKI